MPEILSTILGGFSSLFATLIGAFAGGGASLILLPLLLLINPTIAYASALTVTKISALIMTLVSGKIHFSKKKPSIPLFAVLTITGIIGTAIGTYLVQYKTNEALFKHLLGAVMLATAIYLITAKKKGLESNHERRVTAQTLTITAVFGLIVNILNGIFGGTGIFSTLYLVLFMRKSFLSAIGYTMTSYAVINIAQTSYLLITEPINPFLALLVVIGAITGSMLGTHLQFLKGNKWVKTASIVIMMVIGLKMISA